MKISLFRVQEELDLLVDSIAAAVIDDDSYSERVGDKIIEMHKEAFSKMYHHITFKEGRLCLYLSPDDDFNISSFLDLEQEIIEYISESEEHKDRLYSLVSRICGRGE
jgi:hypothetical protein